MTTGTRPPGRLRLHRSRAARTPPACRVSRPTWSRRHAGPSRRASARSRRAVLYVHGWNDYFFQTHLADFWATSASTSTPSTCAATGAACAAGTCTASPPTWTTTTLELDAAADLIAADHDQLVADGPLDRRSGHRLVGGPDGRAGSTALVLNSPWLDLQGSALVRALGAPVIDALGARAPTAVAPAARPRPLRPRAAPLARGRVGLRPRPQADAGPAGPGRLAAGRPARAAAGRGRPWTSRCPALVLASARTELRPPLERGPADGRHRPRRRADRRPGGPARPARHRRPDRGGPARPGAVRAAVREEAFDEMGRFLNGYLSRSTK